MPKLEVYIRHLLLNEFKRNHTAADAVRNISVYLGENILSHSTAQYWFRRFRQGEVSLEDLPRSGRSPAINIQRLRALIEADPTQSIRKLAKQLNISHTTVERRLRQLGIKFKNGYWIYSEMTQEAQNRSSDSQFPSLESQSLSSFNSVEFF